MRIIFFIIIVLFYTQILYAKEAKVFYLFGGGGESPEADSTIFDSNLLQYSVLSENLKYDTSVIFGGDQKNTRRIVSQFYPNANFKKNFSKENFDQALMNLKEKIQHLNKDDQLLISISTHGAMKDENSQTHMIALADQKANDLINLQDTKKVSIDEIIKIAKLAADKGIKVAITDFSCFSGNLLNIEDPRLCLISSAGKNTPSFIQTDEKSKNLIDFGNNFAMNLTAGKNLEEIFLKAVKDSKTVELPMISTPEGRYIHEAFTSILEPFVQTDTSLLYQVKDLKQIAYSQCKYPNYLENFEEKIKTLKSHILYPLFKNQLLAIEVAVKKYYQMMNNFTEYLKASELLAEDYKKAFAYLNETYPNFKRKDADYFSIENFLKTKYGSSSGFGVPTKVDPKDTKAMENYLKEIEEEKKIQQDIFNKFPQIREKIKAIKANGSKQFNELEGQANIITNKMREIYSTLYADLKKKSPNNSNSCREFKL